DRMLEAFFRDLDAGVGRDNYLAVLTSDHGFMPAPEHSASQGHASGRVPAGQMLGRVNAELERTFGVPGLAPFISASALVIDRELVRRRGLDFDRVADAARRALLAEPAIGAAHTRRELESGSPADAPFLGAMRKSWHKSLSGDVQYSLKPYWMLASSTSVTTHGSPHAYDTHVPILLYGPRWVQPGRVDRRVEVVDIAPTLSGLLGIAAPSSSEGRPLPLTR
ncbi:MAG TPA: alkaline phosphatase family protein, partial [Ramlibacter sp.]|nr:alkaline phosphatase family protein [Ramlibacter sp.]